MKLVMCLVYFLVSSDQSYVKECTLKHNKLSQIYPYIGKFAFLVKWIVILRYKKRKYIKEKVKYFKKCGLFYWKLKITLSYN